jgi:putative ABC transport system permease protein
VSLLRQSFLVVWRRPLRTFLTALGIAFGIATIVALLAVSQGAQQSASKFFKLGPSDLGLFQANAADPTTSVLPTSMAAQLDRTPGVAASTPLILLLGDIPKHAGAIAFGADPNGFLLQRLVFLKGRIFNAPDEAVVGSDFAASSHLGVGSTLTVARHHLRIVGVYHIGVVYQDQGAFIPLAVAQKISNRPSEATTIAVKLGAGAKPAAATRALHRRFGGLEIISGSIQGESIRSGINAQLLSKMALVIVVLAMVIGGIGVVNTMLISVSERRTEFALLSAVGWSSTQIATRVLFEGILTTLGGAILGLILGVFGAQALVHLLSAGEYTSPVITAWVLGRGLLVGVLVGVLGGLLPAWRATRVSPARALAQQ